MLQQINFIYHLLRFAKDTQNTNEIFKFTDSLMAAASSAQRVELGEVMLQDPGARDLYDSGNRDYLYKPFNLAQLRKCAPGTLGHTYAKMMDAAGLDPEFFAYNKVVDPISYFVLRIRKTHDLHHVVTGFSTAEVGEVGLQGFYLGQWLSQLPMAITAAAFLSVIAKGDRNHLKNVLDDFVFGYQAGLNATKLHGVIWENHWDTDVKDLRDILNIKARPEYLVAA